MSEPDEQFEMPLDCPDCESRRIRPSLVEHRGDYGLGLLCLDCGGMNILEFEVLKELIDYRKRKVND